MIKANQETLKRRVVAIIGRNGGPLRTQDIADKVTLPQDVALNDLLTALVAEGRLTRGYTLLANGRASDTFDLGFTA